MAAISNGNKQQLRKNAFLKRKKLSNKTVEKKSQLIADGLFKNFNFINKNLHLFYPIEDNNEVNTWKIHKRLTNKKLLFTSLYYNELKSWGCVQFSPLSPFEKGQFKIPIPKVYNKIDYKKIDIIIVPLLLFDKNGHRIGYGKGIYDRILYSLNKNCVKIGVSLFECSDQLIDFQEHDVSLDYCQTARRLHKFDLNT